ncbi:hypothetical protein D3C80_982440 [compost metagenome]
MGLFSGTVMGHRPVGIEGCDSGKAQGHVARPTCPCGTEVRVDVHLSEHLLLQCRFQPTEEFTQGRAVLLHGLADMGGIGCTFAGFEQGAGVEPLDKLDAAIDLVEQATGHPRRVYQQACSGG